MRIVIKRGDTRTAVRAQLLGAGGAPVDLAGASVRFIMADFAGRVRVDRACEIVEQAQGRVRFVFEPPETDVAGTFRAEFEAVFPDGRRETYPNDGYLTVEILRDLG